MGTLLEAIGIVLETYFGFGFPNGSPIGDNLLINHLNNAAMPLQSDSQPKPPDIILALSALHN